MKLMEEKILSEGVIMPGGVIKVGSFLNERIDTLMLKEVGEEIARLYKDSGATLILTIEISLQHKSPGRDLYRHSLVASRVFSFIIIKSIDRCILQL